MRCATGQGRRRTAAQDAWCEQWQTSIHSHSPGFETLLSRGALRKMEDAPRAFAPAASPPALAPSVALPDLPRKAAAAPARSCPGRELDIRVPYSACTAPASPRDGPSTLSKRYCCADTTCMRFNTELKTVLSYVRPTLKCSTCVACRQGAKAPHLTVSQMHAEGVQPSGGSPGQFEFFLQLDERSPQLRGDPEPW